MNNYKALFLMQQIYATLFSLTNKIQIKGDEYCEPLTSRQLMAMVSIMHLPENETTLNNIAKKLGTTKQSIKQLITNLENKGYVITLPSQYDKRAVNVKITEAGTDAMKICAEKSIGFFGKLSKDFSIEEMEILWTLLKKLYRFDGEEQDGFEEEAEFDMGEDADEIQERALNEFERMRNYKK
ncbi:MarR family winged helix-turn-helix transcriptional regulator [Clostridium saccharobutylicum]|uniref:Regulatory protein MarR n=1 Tax=Clostridium saccharobutylicum DSM 13864 TaxID=1345695 RepID=U5MRK5_CLOSA|nr:MarR family transcriptional regulator [Clostridium saccharobutylicum]AGX43153.1 regulatory protein MarR [Clostridium saccharobutylicum DSM 13864]AQR90452.1 transcriptional activatory protein BadR [Clostridium saccharobutylicum]AQS00358.1 transcriptional activatory protein BadR [Clostridium saccharobutylicum]AQS14341.1 transcriptional activatory protein BadR [Clostridium saccharobutylicum]MBA2906623.1 DNA-binding MarR family transcriptional regulator [Clostridium saccharobutylicum]